MKEILCHSRVPPVTNGPQVRGFSRCGELNCALCPFAKNMTQLGANGFNRRITQSLTCKTKSGVYAIFCEKCHLFYIGRTAETVEARFKQHKRDIEDRICQKTLARHFREGGHNIKQHLRMFLFLKVTDWRHLPDMESESIARFKTHRHGLNERE